MSSTQHQGKANLTLVNNTAGTLKVLTCGSTFDLAPHTRHTRMVELPKQTLMPVVASSNLPQFNFQFDAKTGETSHSAQEYDYPLDGHANVYQHIGQESGTVRAMTLNIGPAFSSKYWMSMLDITPVTTLADITIPGTHDSATWKGSRASQCQKLTMRQQLEAGIRWFDLRLSVSGDDMLVYHGPESQDIYLAKDLLPVIKDFLATYSSETVIICVQNVSWSHQKSQFDPLLKKLLIAGVSHNKLYDRPHMPKLVDLAGCVVLMRQDAGATFGIMAQDWPDDDSGVVNDPSGNFNYSVQNVYKFGPDVLTAKWGQVHAQMERSVNKTDGTAWYVNFTSASRAPITDPIDIAIGSGPNSINYRLHSYLCQQAGPQLFGTVPIDFPEAPYGLIKLLISMNKLK